jgi:hypothetical protein
VGDQGVDESVILKYIFDTQDVRLWTGFKWLGEDFRSWNFFNTMMNVRVQSTQR